MSICNRKTKDIEPMDTHGMKAPPKTAPAAPEIFDNQQDASSEDLGEGLKMERDQPKFILGGSWRFILLPKYIRSKWGKPASKVGAKHQINYRGV